MIELLYAILMAVGALIVGFAVAALIFFRAGMNRRKKVAEAAIGSAEAEAERILKDAAKQAESSKKEALVKAKDEIYRLRNESEKEIKERRADVQRQENRLQQKEETLDRKIENQISYLAGDKGIKYIRLRVSPYVASFLKRGLWSLRLRWCLRYRCR